MRILRFLRWSYRRVGVVVLALVAGSEARAQQGLTWDQVKAKFETVNPALKADADNVDEMKAGRSQRIFVPAHSSLYWQTARR
jgi:cobalt-zinc-cadmium efflux system outer membrane protein